MSERTFRIACAALLALVCMGLSMTCVRAGDAEPAREHLRFFHANRDFILRAFERLPADGFAAEDSARAWDFDPFAGWNAADAVATTRARLDTASTPADLLRFHAAVDSLLQEAAAAAARLDDLDYRFAQHLRTTLEVTLETAQRVDIARIEAWLDGEMIAEHEITAAESSALVAGGVLEVARRVIEPREQDLEVRTWFGAHEEPSIVRHAVRPQADKLLRVHLDIPKDHEQPRIVQSTLGGSR